MDSSKKLPEGLIDLERVTDVTPEDARQISKPPDEIGVVLIQSIHLPLNRFRCSRLVLVFENGQYCSNRGYPHSS
jgi:hypothetical protein